MATVMERLEALERAQERLESRLGDAMSNLEQSREEADRLSDELEDTRREADAARGREAELEERLTNVLGSLGRTVIGSPGREIEESYVRDRDRPGKRAIVVYDSETGTLTPEAF